MVVSMDRVFRSLKLDSSLYVGAVEDFQVPAFSIRDVGRLRLFTINAAWGFSIPVFWEWRLQVFTVKNQDPPANSSAATKGGALHVDRKMVRVSI